MKTKLFGLTFLAFLASVLPFTSFGQDVIAISSTVQEPENVSRKFGLSANIQNGEPGLTFPIFITQKFVLAPSVGLTFAKDVGTDISVGLIPKLYFSTERFAPYAALRAGVIINKPANKPNFDTRKTSPDILAGLAGGAEYFLIPNFSFGVEGQLNVAVPAENSVRFGREGGIVAGLGTAVTASIYFTRK